MDYINKEFKHSTFGVGVVVNQMNNYITIEFPSKKSIFDTNNPDTFTKFLTAVDPAMQEAIIQEKEVAKAAAEEAKRAVEEAARIKAEEEAAALAAMKTHKSTSAPKRISTQQRIEGKPMTFYVFQGGTFDQECQGGYLWAPITNKTGDTFHHWDRLSDVRAGDIILHGFNGNVQAISITTGPCYECLQPAELRTEDAWDLEGRRVDTNYIVLNNPIKTASYTDDIIRLCNTKYAPFNKFGTGNMGYLYEINREMAHIFVAAAAKANPYIKGSETIQNFLSE